MPCTWEAGIPKGKDFFEESDWSTPFLTGLSQFSIQSLPERPLQRQ